MNIPWNGGIAAKSTKGHFINKQPMHLRLKSYTKVNELVRKKGMPITFYDFPSYRGLDNIIFKRFENIMSFFTNRVSSDMDRLWHAANFLSTPAEPRPNWNSFMQDVTKKIHQGPILSCCPSLTFTPMTKHAYTPLSTPKNTVVSPDFLV